MATVVRNAFYARHTKPPPRLGRPPSYNRDLALGAIRDVLWGRGLSAASLDDIAAATSMNRPSLYGAFGDKRAMYLEGLGPMPIA
ncbi:MAG: helix-turn-helix domain-containing protein [Polyangiaceae bacterium]